MGRILGGLHNKGRLTHAEAHPDYRTKRPSIHRLDRAPRELCPRTGGRCPAALGSQVRPSPRFAAGCAVARDMTRPTLDDAR